MKILVVCSYLPWPLSNGGNAAMFSTLQCLSSEHEFTLLCPVGGWQLGEAEVFRRALPSVNLRVVSCYGNGPSANPLRRLAGRVRRWIRSKRVSDQGAESIWDPFGALPEPFIIALAEELERCPDLCQVEFAQMMSVGNLIPRDIPCIFVHHQIHYVYTRLCMDCLRRSPFDNYREKMMYGIELAFLRTFNAIITFSDVDRFTLQKEPFLPPIHTSPFPVPVDIGFVDHPADEFNGSFCYLGSQDHFPNSDGLSWLLEEIWPGAIQRLPNSRLKVFGSWGPDWKAKAAPLGQSVAFAGFVPDLGAAIRGGILLVPLRIGSGIRTKILAALAQGVPCISTRVGAEGIDAGNSGGIVFADSEAEFVTEAISLATTPADWQKRAGAGLAGVRHFHSPEAVRQCRNQIYQDVLENHKKSRQSS